MEDKIEQFWRDATGYDVARVMKGQAVWARFRDSENTSWYLRELRGWNTGVFICSQSEAWRQCKVYDPPEWFVNKPDPGEGYRLLEKFPPEDLQEGDEAWENHRDNEWSKSNYAERGWRHQSEKLWYRRRIETNSPASSDGCRSREDIPSLWRVLGKFEQRLASDAYWSQGAKDWIIIGNDRTTDANELDKWHAIRQMEYQADYALVDGYIYHLPNGSKIRITEKGFEVL
jgi:hypothetical protein